MDELQRLNYLHWMKERGQSYLVPDSCLGPRPVPLPAAVGAGDEPDAHLGGCEGDAPALAVPISQKHAPSLEEGLLQNKASPEEKLWAGVVFYSGTVLSSSEHEMVARIATALDLSALDFIITFGEGGRAMIAGAPHCRVIAMGGDDEDLAARYKQQTVLNIPHPGAMLREPQLKISAWQTLQKLKATR